LSDKLFIVGNDDLPRDITKRFRICLVREMRTLRSDLL
jgi:hypothetical protein